MADDDNSEGIYICYDCVGDAYLKEEIRREGHNRECHLFGDLATLKTWEGTPAITQIVPTDEYRFFHRARIAYSESELREILTAPVKKLGPPPSRLARAGRMNAAGISVFYGAIEADTCIAECSCACRQLSRAGPIRNHQARPRA